MLLDSMPGGRLLYTDGELSVFERWVLVEGKGVVLINARTQARLVQSRGPALWFYAGWLASLIGLGCATLGPSGFGWLGAGVALMGLGAYGVQQYHARCLRSLVIDADGRTLELASRSPALDSDADQLHEAQRAVMQAAELQGRAEGLVDASRTALSGPGLVIDSGRTVS